MEARIHWLVIPEVQAEVQESDFGGESEELEASAVWVGLGCVPDVLEVDGEGGLPPGEGEEVGVKVDVDAGGVARGNFERDVGRGGFRTRPYGWLGGVADRCHARCDGVVIFGVDEDVDVAEGAVGGIRVEVGDEGPAFEDDKWKGVLF